MLYNTNIITLSVIYNIYSYYYRLDILYNIFINYIKSIKYISYISNIYPITYKLYNTNNI